MEKAVPNAQLAEIDETPCIWIGWDDAVNISLWDRKRTILVRLEAALCGARKENDISLCDKVLAELDKVNSELKEVNAKTAWLPCCIFATFNHAEHYEDALDMKEIEVGGLKCKILPAPEPETVLWEHLEYTAQQRKTRKRNIIVLTFIALMIGAGVISYANFLKIGTKYTAFCKDVIGNDRSEEYDRVCPGANLVGFRPFFERVFRLMVRRVWSIDAGAHFDGDHPWAPGGDSDRADLYHNMFIAVHDHDGDLFVAEEGSHFH